jgi:hypothetical protein
MNLITPKTGTTPRRIKYVGFNIIKIKENSPMAIAIYLVGFSIYFTNINKINVDPTIHKHSGLILTF